MCIYISIRKNINKSHSFCGASFPITVTHDVMLDYLKLPISQRIPDVNKGILTTTRTSHVSLIMTTILEQNKMWNSDSLSTTSKTILDTLFENW